MKRKIGVLFLVVSLLSFVTFNADAFGTVVLNDTVSGVGVDSVVVSKVAVDSAHLYTSKVDSILEYRLFSSLIKNAVAKPADSTFHVLKSKKKDLRDAATLSPTLSPYFFLRRDVRNGQSVLDTVSVLYNNYIGKLDYLDDPSVPARYIASDPDYYLLFIPIAYYHSPIHQYSTLNWKPLYPDESKVSIQDINSSLLPYDNEPFVKTRRNKKIVNRALLALYLNHPNLVITNEESIMSRDIYDGSRKFYIPNRARIIHQYRKHDVSAEVGKARLRILKPNWWSTSGNFSFQMTQNHISDNWYKGGESNYAGLAYLKLTAKYDDEEKRILENTFESKLGMSSTPSDTYHDYLFSSDLLRLYNKFGLQASKRWYYTLSSEVTTQFCHGYKADKPALISAFLAPLDWKVSLGMDYKVSNKVYTLSVFLSPVTYSLRYVGNDKVDETSYGLDKGKCVKNSIGSQIKPTLEWKITSNISLESKFNYLTNYTWTRIDWENTFNLTVNKYLSTQIYIYSRYDDSTSPTSGNSHFQLKELFSFGINYSF